jgi:3-phosphoglycerate kinase
MKFRLAHAPLIFIIIVAGGINTATALMEALSIDTLVKASSSIIRGEVVDTQAMWSESGDEIVTRVTIRVQKDFKRLVSDKFITVEYLGGEVGDIGMMVSDSPQMFVGEEIIIFLEQPQGVIDQQRFHIVGSAQGKYTLEEDGMVRTMGFSLMEQDGLMYRELSETDLIQQITDALQ